MTIFANVYEDTKGVTLVGSFAFSTLPRVGEKFLLPSSGVGLDTMTVVEVFYEAIPANEADDTIPKHGENTRLYCMRSPFTESDDPEWRRT
jgi:hypothetical protein